MNSTVKLNLQPQPLLQLVHDLFDGLESDPLREKRVRGAQDGETALPAIELCADRAAEERDVGALEARPLPDAARGDRRLAFEFRATGRDLRRRFHGGSA